MNIQWFGTAFLKLNHNKTNIIFDPFEPFNKQLQYFHIEDFADTNAVFITHGHFDHILSLPKIYDISKADIFCGKNTCKQLIKLMGNKIPKNKFHIIDIEQEINIGDIIIKPHPSKHIKFDFKLIISTLFNKRVIYYYNYLAKIFLYSFIMKACDICAYEIRFDNKIILHFGSANISNTANYPDNIDLLTLPFQGRSDIVNYAISFIKLFHPKSIFLHHFDDTFPPISKQTNIKDFTDRLSNLYPHIPVIIPQYSIPYPI